MGDGFTRERALELLWEWTASESLRKHGLAVEACTRSYGVVEAARLGLAGAAAEELVAQYSLAGLLHDFDYERHPSLEEHPFVGVKFLREQGWPESVLHAILAHAPMDIRGNVNAQMYFSGSFSLRGRGRFRRSCAPSRNRRRGHAVGLSG